MANNVTAYIGILSDFHYWFFMGKDLIKNIGLLANKYKNVLIGDKLRPYFDQKDFCLVMIFFRWDDKITSYFKKILSRTCTFEHLKTIFGERKNLYHLHPRSPPGQVE